jgi:hypothetical protein
MTGATADGGYDLGSRHDQDGQGRDANRDRERGGPAPCLAVLSALTLIV